MTLKLNGSSSGYTAIDAPASAGSNTLVLPADNGSADEVLKTDGSGNLDWVAQPSSGLSMADSWVITSNLTESSAADVTANWARHSAGSSLVGSIGSAMTESSGIFTFPETGIYAITITFNCKSTSGARSYIGVRQYISSNSGGAYTKLSSDYTHAYDADAHFVCGSTILVDVTSASTFRYKCDVEPSSTVIYFGNTANKNSGVTFIKIGDT